MLDYSGGGKSVGNLGNLDEPQRHDAVSLLTDNHPANTSRKPNLIFDLMLKNLNRVANDYPRSIETEPS